MNSSESLAPALCQREQRRCPELRRCETRSEQTMGSCSLNILPRSYFYCFFWGAGGIQAPVGSILFMFCMPDGSYGRLRLVLYNQYAGPTHKRPCVHVFSNQSFIVLYLVFRPCTILLWRFEDILALSGWSVFHCLPVFQADFLSVVVPPISRLWFHKGCSPPHIFLGRFRNKRKPRKEAYCVLQNIFVNGM